MHTRRIRLTGASIATVLLLGLAASDSASAAPFTSSRITAPADGSYYLEEPPGGPEMTIGGTVEGPTKPEIVDVQCDSAKESTEVVEVEEGELKAETTEKWTFTVKVPASEIGEEPCVLRAVPEGTGTAKPGTASPFEGPRVAYSEFQRRENATDKTIYSFEIEARTLSTVFEIDAAGGCGLGPTRLLSTPGLIEGDELFRCAGGVYRVSPAATRAAIQIGGRNAYDPETADTLLRTLKPTGAAPTLTVAPPTFNKVNGLKSIHETDPLVVCEGKTVAYPETSESCESFASAGITLERTWTVTHGGRLITIADTWRSTDAAPHTVSALYGQEVNSDTTSPGTWEFPGSTSFAPTETGEAIPLTSGEGAILYREAGSAEETPGAVHPLAAITFDTSPAAPTEVGAGTGEGKSKGSVTMPYSLDVPAGGTRELGMSFAEGYTLAEVCALAEEAKSGCRPSVAIGSPASGTTSATPSVTVTGTAGDSIGLSSVTVNGRPVTVTGGTWSTTVDLVAGANQITALATNQAGLTRSAATSVTYAPTPPAPAPPSAPVVKPPKAARVGAARLVKGNVAITIVCTGPAGTTCSVKAALTTVEKLQGGHPTALAAKTKTVTIGSASASIPAGASRTVTIKLNAAGRALLALFHKLPMHLAVLQQGAGGPSATIVAQNLTLAVKHH